LGPSELELLLPLRLLLLLLLLLLMSREWQRSGVASMTSGSAPGGMFSRYKSSLTPEPKDQM
jgi:hypothetical protein